MHQTHPQPHPPTHKNTHTLYCRSQKLVIMNHNLKTVLKHLPGTTPFVAMALIEIAVSMV